MIRHIWVDDEAPGCVVQPWCGYVVFRHWVGVNYVDNGRKRSKKMGNMHLTHSILIVQVQLGYYLHNNYKVFKKEHFRGLYSMVSYWLVGTIPLLILRALHFGVYTLMSHNLMGLQSGKIGQFYYLNMFCFQMAHSLLMMFFVYQADQVRSIYYAVPGCSFVLFFFSGMLVKPSTLPSWAAPWMPSISLIRFVLAKL